MSIQLPLPAGWAQLMSPGDPRDRLHALRQDALDAKAEIRSALERLAERHGIAMRQVDYAMGWADDGITDLVYELERELELEIENQNPV